MQKDLFSTTWNSKKLESVRKCMKNNGVFFIMECYSEVKINELDLHG